MEGDESATKPLENALLRQGDRVVYFIENVSDSKREDSYGQPLDVLYLRRMPAIIADKEADLCRRIKTEIEAVTHIFPYTPVYIYGKRHDVQAELNRRLEPLQRQLTYHLWPLEKYEVSRSDYRLTQILQGLPSGAVRIEE